jgi:uncharacterized membrane protein (DUF485 family)
LEIGKLRVRSPGNPEYVPHKEGATIVAEKARDWASIAKNPKFEEIHRRKTYFLFGWWIFSSVYYFLLPIGAGSATELWRWKVIGAINFGYLFALSQFFVSWWLAIYYARWATRVSDRLTAELIEELKKS